MKSATRVLIAALFLVALPVFAQNSGPSANGDFQFIAGDFAKSIQFNVRTDKNGATSGQMSFVGAEDLPDQDVDGGGDSNPGGSHQSLSLTVTFDCLTISGNRAVAGGVISGASVGGYEGLRTLLIVEDGGEGSKAGPDKFAWGLYRQNSVNWIASDAELTFDPGVGLTWHATDAEREDDAGKPSHPSSNSVDCGSFPVGGYDLQVLPHGAGNVNVKP